MGCTVGLVNIQVFWDETPCCWVGGYWNFDGTHCLSFTGQAVQNQEAVVHQNVRKYSPNTVSYPRWPEPSEYLKSCVLSHCHPVSWMKDDSSGTVQLKRSYLQKQSSPTPPTLEPIIKKSAFWVMATPQWTSDPLKQSQNFFNIQKLHCAFEIKCNMFQWEELKV